MIEDQASPEPESEGTRRLREARVGGFQYTPAEWAALPEILKHPNAPSHAVRRAIEAQRQRRRSSVVRVEA